MKDAAALKIRVLVFRSGPSWIAQGIDYDICAQAQSIEALPGVFEVTLRAEAAMAGEEDDPLSEIPPAPVAFRNRFDKACAHRGAQIFLSSRTAGERTYDLEYRCEERAPAVQATA